MNETKILKSPHSTVHIIFKIIKFSFQTDLLVFLLKNLKITCLLVFEIQISFESTCDLSIVQMWWILCECLEAEKYLWVRFYIFEFPEVPKFEIYKIDGKCAKSIRAIHNLRSEMFKKIQKFLLPSRSIISQKIKPIKRKFQPARLPPVLQALRNFWITLFRAFIVFTQNDHIFTCGAYYIDTI